MSDSPVSTDRADASRPVWLQVAFVAMVVAAAIVSVIVIAASSSAPGVASSTPQASASTLELSSISADAPLAWYDPTTADPALGASMPSLEGADFEGSPVAVAADGRAKLLLFLAHWCPHCQREVPLVQAWVDGGNLPGGIDLVSIATAIDPTRPNYPPETWLESEGWSAPVIVDATGEIADRFGLSAFPFWVMVDDEGRVAGRMAGVLEPEALDELSRALVADDTASESGAE